MICVRVINDCRFAHEVVHVVLTLERLPTAHLDLQTADAEAGPVHGGNGWRVDTILAQPSSDAKEAKVFLSSHYVSQVASSKPRPAVTYYHPKNRQLFPGPGFPVPASACLAAIRGGYLVWIAEEALKSKVSRRSLPPGPGWVRWPTECLSLDSETDGRRKRRASSCVWDYGVMPRRGDGDASCCGEGGSSRMSPKSLRHY